MKTKLRITNKGFHFSPDLLYMIRKGNRKAILFLFFTLLLVNKSMGQLGQGPLNWTEPIKVESNGIFLMWTSNPGYNSAECFQKVYNFNNGVSTLPIDSMISSTPVQQDSRIGAGIYSDAATGKFTIGPRENVVSIWNGDPFATNSYINIMIPKFDTTEAMWTNSIQESIIEDIQNDHIYVRTADIDGDSLDEFIVSFLDSQDSVQFRLYDVDEDLNPILLSSFSDIKVHSAFANFSCVRYTIETGDFNNDGTDELALLSIKNGSQFNLAINIYNFINNEIVALSENDIYSFSTSNTEYFAMGVVAGEFLTSESEELGISIFNKNNGQFRSYNWLAQISDDLEVIDISDDRQFTQSNNESFCMSAGDIDNDGIDEIVCANEDNIYVIQAFGDSLALGTISNIDIVAGGSSNYGEMNNSLKITDGNQDGKLDVILVKDIIDNNQQEDGFNISIYSNDVNGDLELIGQLFGDEQVYVDPDNADYQYRPYAIAVGNFEGLNFTIGAPTYYSATDIVKPIVVLNAPPIHFDMFDDEIYDVNDCYNGGECDFVTTYTYSNSETVEVQTQVHKDWTISAGLAYSGGVSVEPMGVGISYNIETHLLYNHGEHFSNSNTDITEINVEVQTGASEDDKLFSTVVDYDLWEYPVYFGNETIPRSTILTSVPVNVAGQWFPSKSYTAQSYLPDHEVSNILSYKAYDLLGENPNSVQLIQADYVSDSYELDASSDYNWNLTMSEFTENQADTVRENGLSVRLQYGLYVFEGDYEGKNTVTHKTSVSNTINLDVHLGAVDMGIGDVKYTITPYSYWDKNDALVVDYTAKPEISPPGYPETWWQEKYGEFPDPTFILPWRLDPEKGFTLSEDAKRHQSKDIIFSPENPLPGDTLTIIARVRNFSLIATTSNVDVSFFIGDPDIDGTAIFDINGSNTVSTMSLIPARDNVDAIFKWVVPENLISFPRIYAVLDVDDEITEVHETNNKGFNVLGFASGINTGIEEELFIQDDISFSTVYPNPFTTYTNINYTLSKGNETLIRVYDNLGKEVVTLMNKYQSAGEYLVPFNADKLRPGVYYYIIQSGTFYETKKMLLLK